MDKFDVKMGFEKLLREAGGDYAVMGIGGLGSGQLALHGWQYNSAGHYQHSIFEMLVHADKRALVCLADCAELHQCVVAYIGYGHVDGYWQKLQKIMDKEQ